MTIGDGIASAATSICMLAAWLFVMMLVFGNPFSRGE